MSAKLFAVETIDPSVQLFRKENEEKKDEKSEPFLSTTMGKVSLAAAGVAIGAAGVYLYNKSQQADKA
jgi:hypothetical protein